MKTNQVPSISDFLETTLININKSYSAGMEASAGGKSSRIPPSTRNDGPLEEQYWGDPSGNVRRMSGDQEAIATITPDCNLAEWKALCDISAPTPIQSSTSPEQRFQNACSDARAAFWNELRRHYPEITKQFHPEDDGDDALTIAQFEIATEGAADALVGFREEEIVQVLDSGLNPAVEGGAAENT